MFRDWGLGIRVEGLGFTGFIGIMEKEDGSYYSVLGFCYGAERGNCQAVGASTCSQSPKPKLHPHPCYWLQGRSR